MEKKELIEIREQKKKENRKGEVLFSINSSKTSADQESRFSNIDGTSQNTSASHAQKFTVPPIFQASTSNQESTNIVHSKVRGFSNLLNISTNAYVLPTWNHCEHCGARKFYRETKWFCCSDGKVKVYVPDSPTELYDLFTSKEPECMEFKKIARGYNNHFAFTSFGVKCDKELFRTYKVNPYSRFFRSLSNMTNVHDHPIQIRCDPGLDQRVVNTSSASQVAVVWVENDDNANIRAHDITIYGHSRDSHRVHYYYAFPSAINFATKIIEKEAEVLNGMKKRSQVSCREYYSYKLQIRPSDMYVKIETTRLDYFRSNQKKICAELYQGIVDSIQNGETRGSKIGKKIVLPQTFTYGLRDMLKRYLDVMTIVQRYGKPDIFLTITCNPNWLEITEELKYNDEVQNRPDLIALSCEIPNKNKYLHLHSVIAKHNMHGLCENLNPKNVCMLASSGCKNKYPKNYCNSNIFGDNSYPLYRRRNNGISIKVRGQMLDNRWVVPYDPYLSAKFDCHTNVEVCSSIKAVKYLCKYVYKGYDQIYRTVYTLQLHIKDHQHVTYNNKDDLSIIIGNEYTRRTMLTEFFRMNEANKFARTLLYRDFPTHFVWNANEKVWTPRKQHIVIRRIVTVNPPKGERYFLRVLLNHIRGPTSFDSFKILNGVTINTYREAALLHGLLKGDNRCEECLSEAIIYKIPNSLRRLFATLFTLCSPNHPKLLWDKYKAYMIDDYVHRNIYVEDAEIQVLEDINSILESLAKNVNDYGIVSFFVNIDETQRLTRMVAEKTINFNIERAFNYVEQLNKDQRFAYDIVMEKIKNESSGTFFINGPGGIGKTFLYKALLISVRSQNFIALATVSSGVAASLLPGGRTAHSRFKIPLETIGEVNCSVSKQSTLGMLLKMSRLII
ncbi:uncharacterized protein LOC111375962 [Olea europaea var. sylvestris]|uniref:uncharacterized protein LOC111375962 n=1 Tax=Olea europaea var. sylvestris TaxID=158386 RepID=UPI000C1D4451|nr:uncharacterized protein LOC111375962 [Olea europaea var. sylvestris]